MYEAKNSKICNFWTFWPVIQLINDLFKIRQKDGIITELSTKISRSAVFAPCMARVLNGMVNQNMPNKWLGFWYPTK